MDYDLIQTQRQVDDICRRYGLVGEVAVAEEGTVWVFIRGSMGSRTDAEITKIRDEIEAVPGVGHVTWELARE